MKSIQDIINHYKKEDNPMIINQNYTPDKLEKFAMEAAIKRYEDAKRRKLVNMAIRNQREPWERVTPDEIVDISEGEE
jgi:hypothetical protein